MDGMPQWEADVSERGGERQPALPLAATRGHKTPTGSQQSCGVEGLDTSWGATPPFEGL